MDWLPGQVSRYVCYCYYCSAAGVVSYDDDEDGEDVVILMMMHVRREPGNWELKDKKTEG